MSINFSHPINHVAISVPDVAAATKWYVEILGFTLLRPLMTSDREKDPDRAIFKIYPSNLNKVTVAALSSGNGVGVELFQFHDPAIAAGSEANFEHDYRRGGFFHMGVTSPDIEALCAKAVAAGAKKIGESISVYQFKALYLQDPWGNVVELLNSSFEQIMSNR